jgi:hypothetical protein
MDALIAYSGRGVARPRYYANDHSRDTVAIEPVRMAMIDGRTTLPRLDREGFALVGHRSAVTDFEDRAAVAAIHRDEIVDLVKQQSGADLVMVNAPGVLRYSERSALAGQLNNSMPARFAHVDISDATAERFSLGSAPEGRSFTRAAHYNVWRVISNPPQDVSLAVCDARSVAATDMIAADAIFDEPDKPEWSFEGWVVAHNPAHRWHWFSDLTPDEAIIFKTHDSDPAQPHCVPHVAFDHPDCPADAPPRASIEMRAIAYWF